MLNSLLRYAPVAADLDPAVGVLDVGCGALGLGCVFDGARFAGQDVGFEARVTPAMFAVRTSPGQFPWAEGAFDTVICLDMLVKLEPEERAAFVAGCARIAARRVLIACPTGAEEALYRAAGAEPPPTPYEPPSAAAFESCCRGVEGFAAAPWPQVNGLLAGLLVFGDVHPFFASGAAGEFAGRREAWVRALRHARFGEGIRYGFELVREEPRDPLVDPARFDASTAAALECVQCGTRLRLETAVGLRCTGCGCIPARAADGSWDLRRS